MDSVIAEVMKYSPVVAILMGIVVFQQRRINQLAAKVDELHKVIEGLMVGKLDMTKK